MFVKNAVDCLCKTGYDVIRKIIGYHVELLEQTWLTWYRKGELDHVYTGDHARPATFFIQKANEFKSGIWVEKEDRRVNAKSLLGVLSLGIVKGTTITLIADGADEKEAVEALVELVKDNFGE